MLQSTPGDLIGIFKMSCEESSSSSSSSTPAKRVEERQSKSLQNKWKKIRTSYSREVKRRAGIKSGSAASYVYFEQLHFLRPTVVINETQNSMDETRTAETNANSGSTQGERPVCKKKKTSDDDNLVQVLRESIVMREERERQQESDSDRLYFHF
ncbi:hypothetical protein EVAR_97000_1 [Eumeta japonica]|uniref:MADF domain-containing protein n=1 Tax=Eumeta variegata TaxID=151549 RepID=A0A4C2A291_EUMVA|nr:hypothetical protein EVAR_97000_1 [Eumeta japonica]